MPSRFVCGLCECTGCFRQVTLNIQLNRVHVLVSTFNLHAELNVCLDCIIVLHLFNRTHLILMLSTNVTNMPHITYRGGTINKLNRMHTHARNHARTYIFNYVDIYIWRLFFFKTRVPLEMFPTTYFFAPRTVLNILRNVQVVVTLMLFTQIVVKRVSYSAQLYQVSYL